MSSAICSSCKWSRWSSTYCVFYKNNISLNIRYCPSYRGIPTISCEVCGKRTRTKFVGENYFRCLECGFYLLTKEGKVIEILDEKEFKKVLQKFKKPESKTAPATSLKKEELKYELFRKLPCGCRSIKVIFPDGDYVFSIRFCELHSRKGMSRIKREIETMLTLSPEEIEAYKRAREEEIKGLEERIVEDYCLREMPVKMIRRKYRIGWKKLYRILRKHGVELRSER